MTARTASLPSCSGLTRALGVDPAGTVSPLRSWVLLEHPGPWGEGARERAYRRALGDAGWDRLERIWRSEHLRPLLVRRPGRPVRGAAPQLLVGAATGGPGWLERLPAQALPDLDLQALAAGSPGHGEPVDGPVLAVCTNGSVDRCCAVRGRPLAAALAAAHPERTWEVSHVGGCRFAANLLVLPDAVLHGGLSPEDGLRVAAAALDGRTDPGRMRGRTSASPFTATAEVALRRRLGLTRLDDLVVLDEQLHADRVLGGDGLEPAGADVLLRVADRLWRATVRTRSLGEQTTACDGTQPATTTDVTALLPA